MSRSSPPEPLLSRLALAAILLLCALSPACSRTPAPPQPEHVYTVRGRIVSLPVAGGLKSDLQIQHEPVPDYINQKGDKAGMPSMIMPFRPVPGLDLSGLAPGDAVEFTWETRWTPPLFSRVSRITRLPAETELHLKGR